MDGFDAVSWHVFDRHSTPCQSEFTRAREIIPNNPEWSSSSASRLKSVVLVPSFHSDGTAMERLLHSRERYCSIVPSIIPPYPGFSSRSFSPRTHGTVEQRGFFRMGEAFHWVFHLNGTVEHGALSVPQHDGCTPHCTAHRDSNTLRLVPQAVPRRVHFASPPRSRAAASPIRSSPAPTSPAPRR